MENLHNRARPEALGEGGVAAHHCGPNRDLAESTQGSVDARLRPQEIAATLARALSEGMLAGGDTAVVFYDLARLEALIETLRNAFPSSTLHTVAVKANPLVDVLKMARGAGCGAEVASFGELSLAVAAGFEPDRIVFDSPVKTRDEIEQALRLGVRVNANSLSELSRIADLYEPLGSRSQIGVRVNPETGLGQIDSTSVAVERSKFGVSLSCAATLSEQFKEYPWLDGLHVHIGSQGMSREQLVEGVGRVHDLFAVLKASGLAHVFNVGGGLPAKYRETDPSVDYAGYAEVLRQRCPTLFDADTLLLTEFGRSLHASCGWVASKIEYRVDHHDGPSTLLTHVGADMFVRKAYRARDWHHDLSVCDSSGCLRGGAATSFDVAGPLCFAGDYLGREVQLPNEAGENDYLLIHDAGAYTFSMWSLYNSRQFPMVIGYDRDSFCTLNRRQSLNEVVEQWSRADER